MKNAELIIFILVVAINGGIALWKKYAELKAKRAVEALARPSAMSRTPAAGQEPSRRAPATRPAAKPAPTAKSKPRSTPRSKQVPRPTSTRKPSSPAPAATPSHRRPGPSVPAMAAAIAPRAATPVAATVRADRWSGLLRGRNALRRAILLREVLGPPRSLEPWKG